MNASLASNARPEAAGFDLVLERVFDAPRELVFRCWTEPEHMVRWWCPADFHVVDAVTDLRVGGRWRVTMQSPAGKDYVMVGTYRDITPPSRLVTTQQWERNDLEPPVDALLTVILEEQGGKTKMTFVHSGLPTAASRDSHKGGWTGAFEHLGRYVEKGR